MMEYSPTKAGIIGIKLISALILTAPFAVIMVLFQNPMKAESCYANQPTTEVWVSLKPIGSSRYYLDESGSVGISKTEDGNGLVIEAHLQDKDIIDTSTGDGQELYMLGDCFEIFLHAYPCIVYWEIWISPKGHNTAILRMFDPESRGKIAPIQPNLNFDLKVTIQGVVNDPSIPDIGWNVFIDLPFSELSKATTIDEVDWRVLIARQNYTIDLSRDNRVLSSYPQLNIADFHQVSDFKPITRILKHRNKQQ